jgi:catechol 2,3-dioxygenase-like lactoylglutathione lyase family enzyme
MAAPRISGIAIDCPDPEGLCAFYTSLLGIGRSAPDAFLIGEDPGVEIWFQEVRDYQPPTWPTQERGQQVHLDLATPDLEAAARYAESVGATRAAVQPADDKADDAFIVMLDPAGHPFCFVPHHEPMDGPVARREDGHPPMSVRMPFIDCPDHDALAGFYTSLLGGSRIWEPDDEYAAVRTPDGFVLGFQRVGDYRPPTWPAQERGQQIHLDIEVDDRQSMVEQATGLGATIADQNIGGSFTVMLDPVGHPFCFCDPKA